MEAIYAFTKNSLGKIRKRTKIFLGQELFYIQRKCPTERHGSEYGGWTICPSDLNRNSVVYSLGVGDDISFDISLIEKYGVTVYAFDPTPKSVKWVKSQRLPKEFNFYEYAVWIMTGLQSSTLIKTQTWSHIQLRK